MADEQPEHQWCRVKQVDDELWQLRDLIAGLEGLATNEVAMTLPMCPEGGDGA